MPDPYRMLGVLPGADDADIHAAWLRLIRQHPPERDPELFQQIRQAYESLRTRQQRLEYELFDTEAPELDDLLHFALPGKQLPQPDADSLRRSIRLSLAMAHSPPAEQDP